MAKVRTKQAKGYKKFLEKPGEGRARVANALNVNIAAPKRLDLFDALPEKDRNKLIIRDEVKLVNQRGKPLSLNVEDMQLIKALSSYIDFNSEEIKEYMSLIDSMDSEGKINNLVEKKGRFYFIAKNEKGEEVRKEFLPIKLWISIPQLSMDIIGDKKEKSLRVIESRILRLASMQQAQVFHIKGDSKTETFMMTKPLITISGGLRKLYSEIRSNRGRKKDTPEVDSVLYGTYTELTSLFFYKALKEYCPLYKQRLFEVWRGNKTEMFAILLSDLESKWRQYYVAAIKAEEAAKEEYKHLKKENPSEYYTKVNAAKKAARIYAANTITIRNRLTTDYESTRQQRSRFIPDLNKAIASLVEYGIITDETGLTKDKQKVMFFFNPDFISDDIKKFLTQN